MIQEILNKLLSVYQDQHDYLVKMSDAYSPAFLLEKIIDKGEEYHKQGLVEAFVNVTLPVEEDVFSWVWDLENEHDAVLQELAEHLLIDDLSLVAELFQEEEELLTLFLLSHPKVCDLSETKEIIESMRAIYSLPVMNVDHVVFQTKGHQLFKGRLQKENPLYITEERQNIDNALLQLKNQFTVTPSFHSPSLN